LTIAGEGGKADIAKPIHGKGSGVIEIVLPFRGDAFRGGLCRAAWRGHLGCPCVSEKSTQGIKTPKREIDLVKDRLKRLKEMLR
jgi:phage-related protein